MRKLDIFTMGKKVHLPAPHLFCRPSNRRLAGRGIDDYLKCGEGQESGWLMHGGPIARRKKSRCCHSLMKGIPI